MIPAQWDSDCHRLSMTIDSKNQGGDILASDLQRQIKEQARLFETTLSSITDFAYSFDLDGRFLYANQALLNLWGLTLEQAVGKNFFDLKYPDDLAAKLQSQIQEVIDTGKGVRDETPYTSPTGVGGYYEYIFRPVVGDDGAIIAVAGSTRDITDRKEVEEMLRHSEERFRRLASELEFQVKARTTQLEVRNAEILSHSKQVQELSSRLLKAQDEERRKIARELHDSAGQSLAALSINVVGLIDEAEKQAPDLVQKVRDIEALVRNLSNEIRTASYLLHPPLLDEIGLPAALSWYVEGLKGRGMNITLSLEKDFGRLSDELELVIFRFVQECLTNVHRHSGCSSATVKAERRDGNVQVEVADQGKGIPAERMTEIQTHGSGVGVQGMRERIRQLGGELHIQSDSSGTKVSALIPI